jgi:hypothetical protein
VSTYLGGSLLTFFGVGLSALSSVSVAGRAVAFSSPVERNSSSSEEARLALASVQQTLPSIQTLQAVTFLTPALVNRTNTTTSAASGRRRLLSTVLLPDPDAESNNAALLVNPISAYQPLSLRALLPGSNAPLTLDFSNLLFYSSSTCTAAGVWRPDGLGGCLPCPVGG